MLSSSLKLEYSITLLSNNDIHHGVKTQSKINWSVGDVTISRKVVNIHSNN